MKKLIVFLFLATLVVACERDTNPENPLSKDLILEESFEDSGNQPTYGNWTVNEQLTSFSGDVSEQGGSWSLQLEPGWIPEEGFAEQYIEVSPGTDTYVLSAWVKGKGYILMGLLSENKLENTKRVDIQSDDWKKVSIRNSITIQADDKLYVKLSAGMTEVANWKILVDLVKLERVSE